jgi:hypothetical protein
MIVARVPRRAGHNDVSRTDRTVHTSDCCTGNEEDPNMDNPFFEHPILNSPYGQPLRHWELDSQGQPTQRIIETRRRAEFTDVYLIEAHFKAQVESNFNNMIEAVAAS